jgi:hypothetical protein
MITGWSWPKRDAVDLTVVNPMAEFDNPKANKKVALAEEAKHRKYDTLCAAENVNMNALGFSVLGGAGPETQKFLASLRERLLQAHGETESKQLAREALERIGVALQRGVAAQLLQVLPSPGCNFAAHIGASAPCEQSEDEAEDDSPGEPECQQEGPIRVVCRPAGGDPVQ